MSLNVLTEQHICILRGRCHIYKIVLTGNSCDILFSRDFLKLDEGRIYYMSRESIQNCGMEEAKNLVERDDLEMWRNWQELECYETNRKVGV